MTHRRQYLPGSLTPGSNRSLRRNAKLDEERAAITAEQHRKALDAAGKYATEQRISWKIRAWLRKVWRRLTKPVHIGRRKAA